jgi:apolipoprotein N-acyltransferase
MGAEGGGWLRTLSSTALPLVLGAWGLALAYPRVDYHALAWLALVPLFCVGLLVSPRTALGWGWLVGTVFFVVLLRWLDHTFRVYSAIPWPLTWLPVTALAAYCGLYFGLVSLAMAWVRRRLGPGAALLLAPALWVSAEWLRGRLMGGFPWGLVGYSQYAVLPLIQIAELTGVYGVSFVVVTVNAAVAGTLVLSWRRAAVGLLAAACLLGATLAFGWQRLEHAAIAEAEISIALMQPAIEQPLKWDPTYQTRTLSIYLELTRRAANTRPDLIVWPETAAPTPLRTDADLQQALADLSARAGAPILVGSIDVADGSPARYFNTAFVLSPPGISGRYDKIKLVPFGEYVPLSSLIGFVRGWAEFIADLEPGQHPFVFAGPPAPFGVVICYEGIFPELVRQFVRGGARFMVNMTNDGWFGRTSGPWQHLSMYSFRAIEHRVAFARAANTGVSAFIGPTGRVERQLGLFERGVLRDVVPLRTRQTLYTRLGDWFVAACAGASAACLGWALGRKGETC